MNCRCVCWTHSFRCSGAAREYYVNPVRWRGRFC